MDDQRPSYHRSRPSLFWPIVLIGAGVIFLLYNLGLLRADPWPLLWQLWPIVLIIVGLDILLGRRSIVGGILSAVFALLLVGGIVALLFAAQNYPAFIKTGVELRSERITYPLGDARQAEATIDFPGGTGYIVPLDDSSNLIEGELHYYGYLNTHISATNGRAQIQLSSRRSNWSWWGDRQEKWTIGLNPRIAYDLSLDTGSGNYEFNLRQFTLSAFALNSGSGYVKLTLPEAGQYRAKIDAGSGDIDIHPPEGVAVRVEYDAGSGDFVAPGLAKISGGRDGVYESPGFSQSGHYVIIRLEGGSGNVTIR